MDHRDEVSASSEAARLALANMRHELREAARLHPSDAEFELGASSAAVRFVGSHPHRALVRLPVRATDAVHVEEAATGVAIGFRLVGAVPVSLGIAEGLAIYAHGGPDGATIIHRPHVDGVEDHAVFDRKPPIEELRYAVDVAHVAGLRLVANSIELLDAAGTPHLRIAPPSVVDASGRRSSATLSIDGCLFDTDPSAPWGRAITAPGASECTVRVHWSDVAYPAIVDPDWTTTTSLPTNWNRDRHAQSLLNNGRVLVAGGYGGCFPATECGQSWLYDPSTATWSATGSLGAFTDGADTMIYADTVLQNGTVLVMLHAGNAKLYDPATGTWSDAGSPATPRGVSPTATLLANGKVLFAGGQIGTTYSPTSADPYRSTDAADIFDPATGSWSVTASMGSVRQRHVAVLLATGKVLVAGGYDRLADAATPSAELYDPVLATWSPTGSMSVERAFHTATILENGRVLVAGGKSNAIAPAELYDLSTGVWATTGSMQSARAFHTSSLLADGTVLVTGGHTEVPSYDPLASVERYDPITSVWKSTDSMACKRWFHRASTLLDGRVLVAGDCSNKVELFAGPAPAPKPDGGTDASAPPPPGTSSSSGSSSGSAGSAGAPPIDPPGPGAAAASSGAAGPPSDGDRSSQGCHAGRSAQADMFAVVGLAIITALRRRRSLVQRASSETSPS